MAGRDKNRDVPKKTIKPKGHPDIGRRKAHSEQRLAEQEEALTLKKQAPEEPGPSQSEALPSAPEREHENPLDSESSSSKATKKGLFPIVGLGASAGGLQALEAFFDDVSEDSGLAYVVITHTDPEHESMLPDLLRRKARIPIKIIEEGMAAEPNAVYIPPSSLDPILARGVFSLQERPGRAKLHMPVDLFLKHLAEDRGELAACVILSGTGTDGTHGVRLIKEKGGLVVVQSLESARHEGMPRSALETGHLGITIMQERAVLMGGEFRIESSPGKGTVVMVEVPFGGCGM